MAFGTKKARRRRRNTIHLDLINGGSILIRKHLHGRIVIRQRVEMALDHTTDHGQKAWRIAPVYKSTALWIENRPEFLGDKSHISAAAKYGRNHTSQGQSPSVVVHVL